MEEPDSRKTEIKDELAYSRLGRSTSRRSTPGRSFSSRSISGRSTPGRSTSGGSTTGRSTPGLSTSGRSTPGRSTSDRSTTPDPPPVPPATYHWEEVKRKRSAGGYPWTHLNKPPFDEKSWVKYERDHVYEPVTPAASTDRIPSPAKQATGPPKDDSRHFLRIPLTEELVMADESGSEPEDERPQYEDEDDDEKVDAQQKKPQSDESIYEGENENSSVGDPDAAGNTRMKIFQQKVKVKADILRTKLQGVTKRKPKQKIVVDAPAGGEKSRRKFGQFATLPKKFTFNAPKVNFSTAFSNFTTRNTTDGDDSAGAADETKSGRFSLPRFGFSKTSSESPKPSKSTKIGTSRLSIPSFRVRTESDTSKVSKPDSPMTKFMDFGTYPRIFSKRRKMNATDKSKTPPPQSSSLSAANGGGDTEPASGNKSRKDSFRRRFFRSNKESTPAPSDEQTATLAVEEELDEANVSKESLAEFGDSDLQEVISLRDDISNRHRSKDTKSLSEHRPGVIEEIDSDEFFLREKGLSRGDVHISNYLSSEIRDVFRGNRTRSVDGVNIANNNNINNGDGSNNGDSSGVATPVRPSRTNSLRRPTRSKNAIDTNTTADRFSTMPKSFGGTKPSKKPENDVPENIITSQTFESSHDKSVLPSTFRIPWRTAGHQNASSVVHMPPKPPTRQRMSKFSTFDTRSMIDLSRKRSQSQIGFLPSMNFSETVPKAPLRRSRQSLAGSERDISVTKDNRPAWSVGGSGVPTPPLRRSRMSLMADADVEERSLTMAAAALVNGSGGDPAPMKKSSATPPRPPPPTLSAAAGYATVDKSVSSSLLVPPQSPARHRRKKSYDVIKSQEFGAFFTIPRSYSNNKTQVLDEEEPAAKSPPPSRPARAYNTLGPSRPLRRRLPIREHEYGDVSDNCGDAAAARADVRQRTAGRSISLDDGSDGPAAKAVLNSGDVIEKMKFRPLPSPPPPPRFKSKAADQTPEPHRRRNTDSALVPFLDRRETSATSSDHDFFADVSRALLASAAANAVPEDDVSVGVQTDPLPDGYELDDLGSCCSSESADRMSRASSTAAAAAERPISRTSTATAAAERPVSRTSTSTEYVDRPTSRVSVAAVENGYAVMPDVKTTAGVICAQRISVNELQVGKITVADIRSQRMGVDDMSGSRLKIAHLMANAGGMMAPPLLQESSAGVLPPCGDDAHLHQDDVLSVHSSRVSSSMYPEVDSDEDRASLIAVPTPPRRRSKPTANGATRPPSDNRNGGTAIDLSAVATDPSITELSCQLFRLCHSNVCSLFNKVAQQVVPEDTEKRRDLQAALCFLSIILAGLLILGFGNEKTIHHHHWDFQFPPANQ